MQAALYTIETVRDIRTRAMHGQCLRGLARYLGWDVDRLRMVARKHEIEIVDEGEAAAAPVVAPAVAVAQAVQKPAAKPAASEQPTISAAAAKRTVRTVAPPAQYVKVKKHPRSKYITIAISEAALDTFEKEAVRIGRPTSGTIAIVADHLARSGNLREFVTAAFAESHR